MRRIVSFLLVVICLCAFTAVTVYSTELSVSAEAAVLYCPENGKVYFSKNENKRMKPASTTKIMTALLTLEYAEKHNKKVRFSREMIAEGSSMYLKTGEVVTLKDLALGMLLCSGNDAANAAAISIDGTTEKFARRMNRRAKRIGMKNTHFVTVSGLDDEEHYTTAYDLALLMAEAMRNKNFADITSRRSASVSFIKPADKSVSYSNHNRLLSTYSYCTGGKTGYTMAAGRCLVTSAEKDGLKLIAVTLNDRDDWLDHTAMYDYGFGKYCRVELDDSDFLLMLDSADADSRGVYAACGRSDSVIVPKTKVNRIKREIFAENFYYTPVRENAVIGRIVYSLDGKTVAEHKLYNVNK